MKSIDVHVYYGKWYFPVPFDKTVDDMARIMEQLEVEKIIMMSSTSITYDFREGNRQLFSDIGNRDNMYGYCFINGNYPRESLAEMERYLPSPKCMGIKYHPEYSHKRPDDDDVLPLFEKLANEYRKPALIHSWPYGEHGNPTPNSHPRFIANLAVALSDLKIIMGHMGGPEWQTAIDIARPHSNIYMDIGSTYTHQDKVGAAVDALGAERVLFGTGGAFSEHLGLVMDAEINDSDRRTVLYDGAVKLFGL